MSTGHRTTSRARLLQIGEEFDRWTIEGPCEERPIGRNHRPYYLCRCRCGTEKAIDGYTLLNRTNRSCGCLRDELTAMRGTRHGECHTRVYKLWCGIKSRCGNPRKAEYKDYGGRGIAMCSEWRDSYEAFRDWARANGYRPGLTIERKDHNGNYEPSNCTWIPKGDQTMNRRNNVILTAFGESKPQGAWVKDPRCKASFCVISGRLRHGWSHEEAIALPPDKHRKHKS